jgi:hypothetical protein
MKSNQKKYLDKVVEILVGETIIDYEQEVVKVSFLQWRWLPFSSLPLLSTPLLSPLSPYLLFSKYCKDTYGVVGDEMKNVWYQYRTILKDKLDNGR